MVSTTDPLGLVSRSYFDALGRTTETVQDFTDGVVTNSSNKTTSYTYNGVGMTSLTAWLTGGGGETTAYVYGVTRAGGSGVDSNDIVEATQWPDPATGAASGSQQETTTVNALGQTLTSTDRNGTTHTLTYDVLARVVSDAVTILGAGVDGSVRRIDTAYDSQGNAYLITSYNAVSGGSIVNQVENLYNGLGQLTAQYQAVGGAVNLSTTPKVQYTYSEMAGGANDSRLTSVVYPDGYTVHYNYATGLDDRIGRLTSLSDSAGTLESYLYLGLGTVVERGHPESTLVQTFISQTGSTGDAGDQYTGLDRFGRVVEEFWYTLATGVPSTAVTVFDVQYGYDADGNVLWRNDRVDSDFSELYSYDSLNQLATFARGTLNGTRTGISGTPSVSESWSYDALGNRTSVTTNGNSQSYSANAQNEITSISGATTPAYDANGNMTTDETGKQFVYDAWNRLVAVKDSSGTTLETFSYDGLDRRVTNTVGSTTINLYYSTDWQVLEEQSGGAYSTRYVWSPVYVNAMVMRDTDTSGTGLTASGTSYQRLWPIEDANWNVTALVDGSGTVVERYVYDPFGSVAVLDASYSIRSGGSNYGWDYLFQSSRMDSVSELYHFRNRDYSATLGSWLKLDPIRFESGDLNLYRMESDNPINRLDPLGLEEYTSKQGPYGQMQLLVKDIDLNDKNQFPADEYPDLNRKEFRYGYYVEVRFKPSDGCPCKEPIRLIQITRMQSNDPAAGKYKDWAVDNQYSVFYGVGKDGKTPPKFGSDGKKDANGWIVIKDRPNVLNPPTITLPLSQGGGERLKYSYKWEFVTVAVCPDTKKILAAIHFFLPASNKNVQFHPKKGDTWMDEWKEVVKNSKLSGAGEYTE